MRICYWVWVWLCSAVGLVPALGAHTVIVNGGPDNAGRTVYFGSPGDWVAYGSLNASGTASFTFNDEYQGYPNVKVCSNDGGGNGFFIANAPVPPGTYTFSVCGYNPATYTNYDACLTVTNRDYVSGQRWDFVVMYQGGSSQSVGPYTVPFGLTASLCVTNTDPFTIRAIGQRPDYDTPEIIDVAGNKRTGGNQVPGGQGGTGGDIGDWTPPGAGDSTTNNLTGGVFIRGMGELISETRKLNKESTQQALTNLVGQGAKETTQQALTNLMGRLLTNNTAGSSTNLSVLLSNILDVARGQSNMIGGALRAGNLANSNNMWGGTNWASHASITNQLGAFGMTNLANYDGTGEASGFEDAVAGWNDGGLAEPPGWGVIVLPKAGGGTTNFSFGGVISLAGIEGLYPGFRSWIRGVILWGAILIAIVGLVEDMRRGFVDMLHSPQILTSSSGAGVFDEVPFVASGVKLGLALMMFSFMAFLPTMIFSLVIHYAFIGGGTEVGPVQVITNVVNLVVAPPEFLVRIVTLIDSYFPTVELVMLAFNYLVARMKMDVLITLAIVKMKLL